MRYSRPIFGRVLHRLIVDLRTEDWYSRPIFGRVLHRLIVDLRTEDWYSRPIFGRVLHLVVIFQRLAFRVIHNASWCYVDIGAISFN